MADPLDILPIPPREEEEEDLSGFIPASALQPVPAVRQPIPTEPGQTDELSKQLGIAPTYTLSADQYVEDIVSGVADAEDPSLEINKLNAAQFVADRLGLEFNDVYGNIEAVSEAWLGTLVPEKTFVQLVGDAYRNGQLYYNRGKLGSRLRASPGGVNPALEEQVTALDAELVPMEMIPGKWVRNTLLMFTNSVPLLINSFLKGGIAAAGMQAGAALAAGGAAAPLTGGASIPAMVTLMGTVGMVSGTTLDLMETMKGDIYLDLRSMGATHDIAGPISDIAGTISGAAESAGEFLLGIKIPGVSRAITSAATRVADRIVVSGFAANLALKFVTRPLATAVAESVEEGIQEITAVASEQFAKDLAAEEGITMNIPPADIEALVTRFGQALSGGFSVGLIFGLGGMPRGVHSDVSKLLAVRDLANTSATKESFVQAVLTSDLAILDTGISDRAWRDYLGRVWDKERPGESTRGPITASQAQGTEITPTTPAESPPGEAGGRSPAQRTPETTTTTAGEYREPSGALHVQVETYSTSREGTTEVMKAGNPETGERYGYALYDRIGDTIQIREVSSEIEADIRRDIVLALMAENPTSEIMWEPLNVEDAEFVESMIANNPRGVDAGLQWLEPPVAPPVEAAPTGTEQTQQAAPPVESVPGAAVQEQLTSALFVQRMSEIFTIDQEEAGVFTGLIKGLAENAGLSENEYIQGFISPNVTNQDPAFIRTIRDSMKKGESFASVTGFVDESGQNVPFQQAGREEMKGQIRAVFTALQGSDFHHALHEFFHALERLAFSHEQIRIFEKALGKLRKDWTTDDIEELADRWEDFLGNGQAPTSELEQVFRQLAELLHKIVTFLKERMGLGSDFTETMQANLYEPSEAFLDAYNALFVTPGSPMAELEVPSKPVDEAVADAIVAPETMPENPPPTITLFDPSEIPIVEIPLERLHLSPDVANFKEDANEAGIVEQLEGEGYKRLGTAAIVAWERLDGRLDVITGRHRWEFAIRTGEETIPTQIVREADGFTRDMAMTFDAESNIRDGQGSVRDYGNYFRLTDTTEEQASSRGLLSRDKGRKGFVIGRYASDGLYTAYRNGQINETKTAAIAAAAPNDQALQDAGITRAKELTADELANYLEILKNMTARGAEAEQADLFGKDDSMLVEAARLAKAAAAKRRELRTEYSALKGALRLSSGEQAKIVGRYGFTEGDAMSIQSRVSELEVEIEGWKDWMTDADMHAELRTRIGQEEPLFGTEPTTLMHDAPVVDQEDRAQIIASAVELFGTTTNANEAGYILPDGRMLDFTGRHYASGYRNKKPMPGQPDYLADSRSVDHRELFGKDEENPLGLSEGGSEGMVEFMNRAGAVRFDMVSGLVESQVVPSAEQLSTIADAVKYSEDVQLEMSDVEGNPIASVTIDEPTRAKIQGFFTRATGLLFHPSASPDPWILKSAEIIRAKMKGPMQSDALRAMLLNNGVKADEMEWTGLDDFLQEDRKVSPVEIADFLKENGSFIEEKVLGAARGTEVLEIAKLEDRIKELSDRAAEVKKAQADIDPEQSDELWKLYDEHARLVGEITKLGGELAVAKSGGPGPKYSEYALGGDYANYSEILLSVPPPLPPLREADPKGTGTYATRRLGSAYESPHFAEADNIIVHVRMDDRVSPDRKLLFVEEIQSDWHQEGRSKGYYLPSPDDVTPFEFLQARGYDTAGMTIQTAEREAGELGWRGGGSIPDAPFKKTWHELGFRRALWDAAEGGYDSLAWTTGQQQADRHDLAKLIQDITVTRHEIGTYTLEYSIDNTRDTVRHIEEGKLQEYIGVELTKKAIDKMDAEGTDVAVLEGDQLKTGGEGMKGFYDGMIVKYANKLGKRWGAKVGSTTIETREDIYGKWMEVVENLSFWKGWSISMEDTYVNWGWFATKELAQERLDKYNREGGFVEPETVHALPITDAMRESVKKGQYLFHTAVDEKAIVKKAVAFFGTTKDVNEAGYILKDGRMLNFSRSNSGMRKRGRRVRDHGMLFGPKGNKNPLGLKNRTAGLKAMVEWMTRSGAMRIAVRGGVMNMTTRPTTAQLKTYTEEFMVADVDRIYVSILDKNGRDEAYQQFYELNAAKIAGWFASHKTILEKQSLLFHYDERWGEELLYGTPIDRGIYDQYVERAAGYESGEAFQADMVEQYGNLYPGDIAGAEAAAFYVEAWKEANRRRDEVGTQTLFDIPGPDLPGESEYDYTEKSDAASQTTDPKLSAKMDAGTVTDKELNDANAVASETDKSGLYKATDEVQAAIDAMTPEERLLIEIGDRLQEAIDDVESVTGADALKNAHDEIDLLYKEFKSALLGNLDFAAELLDQLVWKKAIVWRADPEASVTSDTQVLKQATELGAGLQAAVDKIETRDKVKAAKAKVYAAKKEQMERFKEKVREATANRRARKKYRDAKNKAIKAIMRPPGKTIEFRGYAEVIRDIQKGFDPRKPIERTKRAMSAARRFLEVNPEAKDLMPAEWLQRVYSESLGEKTLAELEEILERLNQLRALGRTKRSIKVVSEQRYRNGKKREAVNAVLRGAAQEKTVGGVRQTKRMLKVLLPTWKPDRVARLLEGGMAGLDEGVFTELLQTDVNEAWTGMRKMVRSRTQSVTSKLKALKLTMNPIDARRVAEGFTWIGETVDIGGFRYTNGKKPTYQDVMYWSIGMNNERTSEAVLYGLNLPADVIAKGVAMLPENIVKLADLIAEDFDKNFPRLRESFIDQFNFDLPAEDFYVPMVRMMQSYKERDDQVAAELTARAGLRKEFVSRHPTYARIDIAKEHQAPIRTDLVNLWLEAVKLQEGFIHQDRLIKRLHSILESDQVSAAVTQKYGPTMNRWIRQYINDLAQADAYTGMTGLERFSRLMRTNAAIGWLSFNLSPVLKQTTGVLNLLADVGPLYLMSAAAQFAGGKGKSILHGKWLNNSLVDLVDSKTEVLANRAYSQESADLQKLNNKVYQALVKEIGTLGMKGLETMDRVTVYIGWKAAYDKALHKTGVEAEAVAAADKAIIRTQPSGRVQDLAQLYRSGELMKWFTMFTSELNVTWNRLTFDVPLAIRRGEVIHALADMISFALIGISIAIASGALQGDDEDENKKRILIGAGSQLINAIPIFGSDILNSISGRQFSSGGVKLVPAQQYLEAIPRQLAAGSYDKAAENLIEGISIAAGLPVSGPAKAIRAIKSGELRDLLGWPKE